MSDFTPLQKIGVWMSSGQISYPKCPGRIRFGHRMVEQDGNFYSDTAMVVECCAHKGHDGPHIHKIDAIPEPDPSDDTQARLVDYPFTLTWIDGT